MFTEQINKSELSQVASEFKELLVKYSADYPDAKSVLKRVSNLLEQAINQEITVVHRKGFFPEEFWENGSLFEIEDLSEICAQFSLLLEGAISLEAVKEGVHNIDKLAEIDEKTIRDKNA